MACQGCGKDYLIVNKRHKLCTQCNRKRMYGEDYKTKGEIQAEKKRKLYKEMDSDLEEGFCKGCGTTQMLTHSHLIPVSKRKDLELNPLNITYHCLKCHPKWESNDIQQMSTLQDFQSNLRKIKILDIFHYNDLMYKLALHE